MLVLRSSIIMKLQASFHMQSISSCQILDLLFPFFSDFFGEKLPDINIWADIINTILHTCSSLPIAPCSTRVISGGNEVVHTIFPTCSTPPITPCSTHVISGGNEVVHIIFPYNRMFRVFHQSNHGFYTLIGEIAGGLHRFSTSLVSREGLCVTLLNNCLWWYVLFYRFKW